ncbi:MAG: hypothetical protein P4L51_27220 [Puia sp.]|nr:hypothetical protein [Puia sp.]
MCLNPVYIIDIVLAPIGKIGRRVEKHPATSSHEIANLARDPAYKALPVKTGKRYEALNKQAL